MLGSDPAVVSIPGGMLGSDTIVGPPGGAPGGGCLTGIVSPGMIAVPGMNAVPTILPIIDCTMPNKNILDILDLFPVLILLSTVVFCLFNKSILSCSSFLRSSFSFCSFFNLSASVVSFFILVLSVRTFASLSISFFRLMAPSSLAEVSDKDWSF